MIVSDSVPASWIPVGTGDWRIPLVARVRLHHAPPMTQGMHISPDARLWPLTADGALPNLARRGPLPEALLELCHDVSDAAQARFGPRLHSVYLSGEGARHWPAPVSYRIILREETVATADRDYGNLQALHLRAVSMLRQPLEITVHAMAEASASPEGTPSRLMARLRACGRCLAGPDLTVSEVPLRPDRTLAAALLTGFVERIDTIARLSAGIVHEGRLRRLSREAGRLTLEALFALVLDQEDTYTEDIELMAGFAALHWPHRRRAISMAERMARDGASLSLELSSFIEHHARWVCEEVRGRL